MDMSLKSVGKDKREYLFTVERETQDKEPGEVEGYSVQYLVRAEGAESFFEFRVVVSTLVQIVRVVEMNHFWDERYEKKGIPEAMIRWVARDFPEHQIVSSSNRVKEDGSAECRIPAATKAWERLQTEGEASYHSDADRYTYVRHCE